MLKRKFPAFTWNSTSLADWLRPDIANHPDTFLNHHRSNGKRFFFDSNDVPGLNKDYCKAIRIQADKILNNHFTWFFNQEHNLGDIPDWLWSPLTNQRIEANQHWCDIGFFNNAVGDIKFIWELSRFAWAYVLVRAYAATGDDAYAEKFWILFDSWCKANPVNMGPNYACGQECAIRLMAMTFAYYALNKAPSSSQKRLETLALAIALHADRIEKNIEFAISTRTNHSLTEAAGIYTAGLLFPEFKYSKRWHERGKYIITAEGFKQIYSDGGYIQHSMNYHRLMLQDFIWVLRLAELNDDGFDPRLLRRVQATTEFLYQMQDDLSGRVPNYGANDGALILPLNSCDYLDYRPVIQSAYYLFHNEKCYPTGLWDEDLLWLFGQKAIDNQLKPPARISRQFTDSGYYTLRQTDSWIMTRCHSFRDRPGHADMLHLELWWKGVNILRDSGSYSYNCEEPWQSYFGSTAAHNTIVIDHQDQMLRAGRFQWFYWTKARMTHFQQFDNHFVNMMQGEHDGYRRLGKQFIHRRSVLGLDNRYWIIVDDILGSNIHQMDVYWHLCQGEHQQQDSQVRIHTPHGPAVLYMLPQDKTDTCQLARGLDNPVAGWESLYYGECHEAPVFICSRRSELPTRFITLISLGESVEHVQLDSDYQLSWKSRLNENLYAVSMTPPPFSENTMVINAEFDNHRIPFAT